MAKRYYKHFVGKLKQELVDELNKSYILELAYSTTNWNDDLIMVLKNERIRSWTYHQSFYGRRQGTSRDGTLTLTFDDKDFEYIFSEETFKEDFMKYKLELLDVEK